MNRRLFVMPLRTTARYMLAGISSTHSAAPAIELDGLRRMN